MYLTATDNIRQSHNEISSISTVESEMSRVSTLEEGQKMTTFEVNNSNHQDNHNSHTVPKM